MSQSYRLFAVLSVFLLSIPAWAQMSLSLNEMPTKSTSILYSNGSTGGSIDHTIKGANKTWDYSGLGYEFQAKDEYKSASSINFFFLSLGLNAFGIKVADSLGFGTFMMKDIYDVYKTTSQKMTAEGRSLTYNGAPIPQFYEDKDEVYRYPFTYQDTSRDSYKIRFSLGTLFSLVQNGTRENVGEGWGTLITPYKTYTNVLKMKTTISGTDSLVTSIISLPIPRNTVEYKWFAKDVVGPVLIVAGNMIGANFTVTSIKFQDGPAPLVGFKADKYDVDTTEIVQFEDTSAISALFRTWTVSPSTFVFENGTRATSAKPEIRFTAPGKYSVELSITNRYGVMKESRSDYINVKTPIDYTSIEEKGISDFSVYPNPFSNEIRIQSEENFTMTLMNAAGELVKTASGNTISDLESLPAGIYLLRLESGEQSLTHSLLKR